MISHGSSSCDSTWIAPSFTAPLLQDSETNEGRKDLCAKAFRIRSWMEGNSKVGIVIAIFAAGLLSALCLVGIAKPSVAENTISESILLESIQRQTHSLVKRTVSRLVGMQNPQKVFRDLHSLSMVANDGDLPEVDAATPHLMCNATCVPSTPLFPCDLVNPYPVRFKLPLRHGDVFSWRSTILPGSSRSDSEKGITDVNVGPTIELGYATILSEIYVRYDKLSEGRYQWTTSFFGGNRFWKKPPYESFEHVLINATELTPRAQRLTQCACYFFTGVSQDLGAIPVDPDKKEIVVQGIDSESLSHLMRNSPFLWSNYLVGRPEGWSMDSRKWKAEMKTSCEPYAPRCSEFLGRTNATAATHFGQNPWVESFESGCVPKHI